jgi:hypothetical protein
MVLRLIWLALLIRMLSSGDWIGRKSVIACWVCFALKV